MPSLQLPSPTRRLVWAPTTIGNVCPTLCGSARLGWSAWRAGGAMVATTSVAHPRPLDGAPEEQPVQTWAAQDFGCTAWVYVQSSAQGRSRSLARRSYAGIRAGPENT